MKRKQVGAHHEERDVDYRLEKKQTQTDAAVSARAVTKEMHMKPQFKPYQLVLVTLEDAVEQGKRSYVGEVMSYTTPEGTLMVRRVPGHPGTLDELPVGFVSVLTPPLKRVSITYAKVGGSGGFPLDMLRYDHCVPVNFKLVHHERLLHRLVPQLDKSFGWEEGVFVVARCVSPQHRQGFTPQRWSSFLWGCKEFKTETYTVGGR